MENLRASLSDESRAVGTNLARGSIRSASEVVDVESSNEGGLLREADAGMLTDGVGVVSGMSLVEEDDRDDGADRIAAPFEKVVTKGKTSAALAADFSLRFRTDDGKRPVPLMGARSAARLRGFLPNVRTRSGRRNLGGREPDVKFRIDFGGGFASDALATEMIHVNEPRRRFFPVDESGISIACTSEWVPSSQPESASFLYPEFRNGTWSEAEHSFVSQASPDPAPDQRRLNVLSEPGSRLPRNLGRRESLDRARPLSDARSLEVGAENEETADPSRARVVGSSSGASDSPSQARWRRHSAPEVGPGRLQDTWGLPKIQTQPGSFPSAPCLFRRRTVCGATGDWLAVMVRQSLRATSRASFSELDETSVRGGCAKRSTPRDGLPGGLHVRNGARRAIQAKTPRVAEPAQAVTEVAEDDHNLSRAVEEAPMMQNSLGGRRKRRPSRANARSGEASSTSGGRFRDSAAWIVVIILVVVSGSCHQRERLRQWIRKHVSGQPHEQLASCEEAGEHGHADSNQQEQSTTEKDPSGAESRQCNYIGWVGVCCCGAVCCRCFIDWYRPRYYKYLADKADEALGALFDLYDERTRGITSGPELFAVQDRFLEEFGAQAGRTGAGVSIS